MVTMSIELLKVKMQWPRELIDLGAYVNNDSIMSYYSICEAKLAYELNKDTHHKEVNRIKQYIDYVYNRLYDQPSPLLDRKVL